MAKERTALVAFWKNYDRKTYLKAAQLADELGYDSFWLPEAWGYDVVPSSRRWRSTRRTSSSARRS